MKERNPYCLLAFAIVLIWALWNYNVSLKLLAGLYDILLPFVIGGCMAFIVNVLMNKLEQYWRIIFKQRVVSRFERPVCLLLSLAIIIGFLAFFVLTIVPELHASMKMLVKMLPPALAKLNIYLQQKAQELSFSADELAVVQAQAKEAYQTMLNYLQNNKRLLLEQTFLATASLLEVLASCVIGFVVAIYCLLEKHRLVRNFKCFADGRADFPRLCWGTAGSGATFGRDVFRRHDALRLSLCDSNFAAGGCAEPDTDSRYLNQCSYRLLFNTGGRTGENLVFHHIIHCAAAH